jgi:SAM-dependent methyltransferase
MLYSASGPLIYVPPNRETRTQQSTPAKGNPTQMSAAPSTTDAPATTWTREEIERFLKEEDLRYQGIQLPHGLDTRGQGEGVSTQTQRAKRFFPDDLTGKSVLDVGCFLGAYCIEAWRRGARKVVGVDISRDHVRQSKTIAEILGAPIEYHRMDIEEEMPDGPFDYVLYLNVLHHARQPARVLDRLLGLTREQLIVQNCGMENENALRRIRKMGGNWYIRHKLKSLPLIVVGKSGVQEKSDEPFYFSTPALRHFLSHQRHCVANLRVLEDDPANRDILIAECRRIEQCVLIGGPTAIGKSTFVQGLSDGKNKELESALGFDSAKSWTAMSPEAHPKDRRSAIERAVYEYDLLRPWRRNGGAHGRDEALDVLARCAQARITTLVASREVLIERLQRSIEDSEKRKGRPAKRLRHVLRLYERPARLEEVMADWVDYCGRSGAENVCVDVTESPRIAPGETWKDLMLR